MVDRSNFFNFLQKESKVGEQAQETQTIKETNLISPPAFRQWSSSSAAHTSRRAASASRPPQAASGLSGKMTTWRHLVYSLSMRMPSLCHRRNKKGDAWPTNLDSNFDERDEQLCMIGLAMWLLSTD